VIEKDILLKLIENVVEGGSWRQRVRRAFGEKPGRCQSACARGFAGACYAECMVPQITFQIRTRPETQRRW